MNKMKNYSTYNSIREVTATEFQEYSNYIGIKVAYIFLQQNLLLQLILCLMLDANLILE